MIEKSGQITLVKRNRVNNIRLETDTAHNTATMWLHRSLVEKGLRNVLEHLFELC